MPNPYYFRSVVDRLWRIANGTHPGDVSARTVNALIKAFPPGVSRYAAAQQMLRAVDAYEYARHLLRDLYDQTSPSEAVKTSPSGGGAPQGAEGAALLTEEEPPDEDDNPL